ncbi:MAG: histidine kinase [Alphaproteobacteria bacterium]|nr:histidine kinase [Alphaproteobacteria bacterium]
MSDSSGTTTRRFWAGHASGPDWGRTIKACLERIGPIPAGVNLGFVYVTDALGDDLASIVTFLRGHTRIEHWVGTVGMGVCAPAREYFDEPAAAVMVAALPPGSFHMLANLSKGIEELDADARQWIAKVQPTSGLVHGDPRNAHVGELVGDLSESAACFLFGGLSSSRGTMAQVADRVHEGGLSGVLFGPSLVVVAGLSQGCTPIGPVRQVSESERNIILAIDGQPALDVLKADMGEILARDLGRAAAYIHAALPVPGSDTGDYLVRNLMGVDPRTRAVAIGALVDPGDRIMFCRRDPKSAEEDLRRMLADVRRRLPGPAQGGIYISCLARGPNMFGAKSRELEIVTEQLGEFPLVGFFANGEISHNRLYGYTGVLAVFA